MPVWVVEWAMIRDTTSPECSMVMPLSFIMSREKTRVLESMEATIFGRCRLFIRRISTASRVLIVRPLSRVCRTRVEQSGMLQQRSALELVVSALMAVRRIFFGTVMFFRMACSIS